jgi:hypothetical protein
LVTCKLLPLSILEDNGCKVQLKLNLKIDLEKYKWFIFVSILLATNGKNEFITFGPGDDPDLVKSSPHI